jgi:hypothetical protein
VVSQRVLRQKFSDGADLTIGDLLAGGARLGLFCDACGRFRYMTTDRLSEKQIVKKVAEKLSCLRCRSNEVTTRPIHRDATTGYWPAESG